MRPQTINACFGTALLATCMASGVAKAAEITVISTDNVMPAFQEIVSTFESRYGDKLKFRNQGAKATQALVESGAQGDVVVGSRLMLDALAAKGQVKAGSIVDFARSSVGVVVRQGAPTFDISTDEKLRNVLLQATSIAYPDPAKGSLGGNYFARLIDQWGLSSRLKGKWLLTAGGDATGHVVADGKAQIGVNQIAEIRSVPGLTFLFPLPPAMTDKVVMSAGVLVNTKNEAAGRDWVEFVASKSASKAIKAHGMDPTS